jgi:hypothetical protein
VRDVLRVGAHRVPAAPAEGGPAAVQVRAPDQSPGLPACASHAARRRRSGAGLSAPYQAALKGCSPSGLHSRAPAAARARRYNFDTYTCYQCLLDTGQLHAGPLALALASAAAGAHSITVHPAPLPPPLLPLPWLPHLRGPEPPGPLGSLGPLSVPLPMVTNELLAPSARHPPGGARLHPVLLGPLMGLGGDDAGGIQIDVQPRMCVALGAPARVAGRCAWEGGKGSLGEVAKAAGPVGRRPSDPGIGGGSSFLRVNGAGEGRGGGSRPPSRLGHVSHMSHVAVKREIKEEVREGRTWNAAKGRAASVACPRPCSAARGAAGAARSRGWRPTAGCSAGGAKV